MDFVFRSVDISSTRVLSVVSKYKSVEEIHPKIYAIGLIILWPVVHFKAFGHLLKY